MFEIVRRRLKKEKNFSAHHGRQNQYDEQRVGLIEAKPKLLFALPRHVAKAEHRPDGNTKTVGVDGEGAYFKKYRVHVGFFLRWREGWKEMGA